MQKEVNEEYNRPLFYAAHHKQTEENKDMLYELSLNCQGCVHQRVGEDHRLISCVFHEPMVWDEKLKKEVKYSDYFGCSLIHEAPCGFVLCGEKNMYGNCPDEEEESGKDL